MLKSFATLIQVAQNKTDSAAIKVGQLNARLAESKNKRDVLVNYRDEYRARLDAAIMRGAPAAETRNFRAFLDKLDEAVRQQEGEIEFWHAQIVNARAQWQSEQHSLNTYNVLGARRDAAAAQAAARREQKQQDEFAARATGAARFAFGE
ncbi:MAG: flagellar export protein FliJ [Burkholderiales bacterium]|nr:flagellar export protein FliJ [Burkholderiales bacterium]